MPKHAFLIIAHGTWDVLNCLLSQLDDESNDIFLHIDKKVAEIPSLYHCKHSDFFLLDERMDVRWGDLSQVKTEMLLFGEAHKHGPYKYYHLLSGVDMPLKSQDEIHRFFEENDGKEFVGFFQGKYHEEDTVRKVSKRYLLQAWNKRCVTLPKWKIAIGQIVRHLFLKMQSIIGYNRTIEVEFKKGHQWVSLSHEAVSLLLMKREWIMKRFSQVNTPDEIYKQTVLWNSDLRRNLYDVNDDQRGAMRLIDWNRGEPYTWQESDKEELQQTPYLFARKFSVPPTYLWETQGS